MKCWLKDGREPRGGGGGGPWWRKWLDLHAFVQPGATFELATHAQTLVRPFALESRRDFEGLTLCGFRVADKQQMVAGAEVPLEALLSPMALDLAVARPGESFGATVRNRAAAPAHVELRVYFECRT